MIYYHIKTFSKSLFLSISKEESESIAKIIRYVININKLIYSLLISIFINKKYIFNHSRFYILDKYKKEKFKRYFDMIIYYKNEIFRIFLWLYIRNNYILISIISWKYYWYIWWYNMILDNCNVIFEVKKKVIYNLNENILIFAYCNIYII